MATFRVIHGPQKYHDDRTYADLIRYVTSPQKVRPGGVIGAAVLPEVAELAMKTVTAAYHKEEYVKLRHSVLSFDPDEQVDYQTARDIACMAMKFYDAGYQTIAAIHEDKPHLHIHFLMNTTNYRTGRKYHENKQVYHANLKYINTVTEEHGIHTIAAKDRAE